MLRQLIRDTWVFWLFTFVAVSASCWYEPRGDGDKQVVAVLLFLGCLISVGMTLASLTRQTADQALAEIAAALEARCLDEEDNLVESMDEEACPRCDLLAGRAAFEIFRPSPDKIVCPDCACVFDRPPRWGQPEPDVQPQRDRHAM